MGNLFLPAMLRQTCRRAGQQLCYHGQMRTDMMDYPTGEHRFVERADSDFLSEWLCLETDR